jgi:hypothetical protein
MFKIAGLLFVAYGVREDNGEENHLVTKMDRYNKYQTKQYTLTHTQHAHKLMVSTWLGDHQGRPSAPLSRCV